METTPAACGEERGARNRAEPAQRAVMGAQHAGSAKVRLGQHTRRCSRCSSSQASRPTMKCGALAAGARSGAMYSPNGSSSFSAASCMLQPSPVSVHNIP
jgi:hypothetical protein